MEVATESYQLLGFFLGPRATWEISLENQSDSEQEEKEAKDTGL